VFVFVPSAVGAYLVVLRRCRLYPPWRGRLFFRRKARLQIVGLHMCDVGMLLALMLVVMIIMVWAAFE